MEVSQAELLEALGRASSLIQTARKYFPKSMHNSDRFDLESTNALVQKVKSALQEDVLGFEDLIGQPVNVYSRHPHRSA
jgi:hypothetical protein